MIRCKGGGGLDLCVISYKYSQVYCVSWKQCHFFGSTESELRMLLYAHTAVLFYVAVYSEHPTDHHYVVTNCRIRFVACCN